MLGESTRTKHDWSIMDWNNFLEEESLKSYYEPLMKSIDYEYSNFTCYPPRELLFRAFEATPYDKVKCVILGQDPYHDESQAEGLSFSVKREMTIPPSLLNIFKEINSELDIRIPDNGSLYSWTKEGILLLNSILSVRAHEPLSHKGLGWEELTDNALSFLNMSASPIVFMLWGSYSRSKSQLITNKNHLILEAAHPSPLSSYRGFFGCNHFVKCNEFLISKGLSPINWKIDNINPSLFDL